MKARSLRYLIGEGFKGAWANRLMTLASICVLIACMMMIGITLLISRNATKALGVLEQQNVVQAFMKDYSWAVYDQGLKDVTPEMYVIHDEKEAKALCDKLAEIENVESVEYVSGTDAIESVKDDMPAGQEDEFVKILKEKDGNPLSASAKITLKSMDYFDETVEKIKNVEGVESIKAQKDLADGINALKKGLMIAGIWILVIFMVISLVVVSNTIRITMYSRKLEISIMKAVGATDAFVRIPFVVEGILIGIVSAGISEGLLYFCYRVANEFFMKSPGKSMLGLTELVPYKEMALLLLGVFVGIGFIAGTLGSLIMIGKYLRREGSEFSAI